MKLRNSVLILFATVAAIAITGRAEETAVDPSKIVDLTPEAIKFVPPAPPREAPEMDEKALSLHDQGTHQIAIVRAEASTQPDIPERIQKSSGGIASDFPNHQQHFVIGLSVTVYNKRLSHLKWKDPQTRESFEAWCGWDWSLLSPFREFKFGGKSFHFFFAPTHIDTQKQWPPGLAPTIPKLPEIEADQFIFTETSSTGTESTTLIEAARDYYQKNKTKLEEVRAAQEKYRKDKLEWEKEHPPKPQNHTLWFKPHRGSRYLKEEVQP